MTVEAIEKSVTEIGKFDAGELSSCGAFDKWLTYAWIDDWFVIAITDANFGRYEITLEDLKRVMNRDPKVHTALICIGEGAEANW